MARAHFVKSARKNNPVAKKGESYYWWAFMQGGRGGPKRYSKTAPTRSQLTQSEFCSTLWDLEDRLGDLKADSYETVADLQGDIEEIKGDLEGLSSDTQDKFNNMPDGLQQGDSGQLLENRSSEVDSLVGELDGIDFDEPEELDTEAVKKDGKEAALKAAVQERCEAIIEEAQGFNWGIE